MIRCKKSEKLHRLDTEGFHREATILEVFGSEGKIAGKSFGERIRKHE